MKKNLQVFIFISFLLFLLIVRSYAQCDDSLYVFVGEKVDVQLLPRPDEYHDNFTIVFNKDTFTSGLYSRWFLDSRYLARFKVLHELEGNLNVDTIEFTAYDHYGLPEFAKFKNSLIFLKSCDGKYIHCKYQFFDVYKTKNNRWASSYHIKDYRHPYNSETTVKPEPISFKKKVAYSIKKYDVKRIDSIYPAPYFLVKGREAYAVWGNYVEELLRLKKEGVLKARQGDIPPLDFFYKKDTIARDEIKIFVNHIDSICNNTSSTGVIKTHEYGVINRKISYKYGKETMIEEDRNGTASRTLIKNLTGDTLLKIIYQNSFNKNFSEEYYYRSNKLVFIKLSLLDRNDSTKAYYRQIYFSGSEIIYQIQSVDNTMRLLFDKCLDIDNPQYKGLQFLKKFEEQWYK